MGAFLLYLADNVGRQVKQAKGVSFVPRIQHTKEMGDVISTVPIVGDLKILFEHKEQLQPNALLSSVFGSS